MINKGDAFHLPKNGTYLLSHSVGRPLKSLQAHLRAHYFEPWEQGLVEPWGHWLQGIEQFTTALGRLFNAPATQFCPQTNVSSGLTKLLQSLPSSTTPIRLLMSENDFPSMGFVAQCARNDIELHFIGADSDMSDPDVWQMHLTPDIDFVFVSHVYSNTGQQAPISFIASKAKERGIKVILDVAQSAGILPVDLNALQIDVMLGSSVKWLCGGPGAAYLWVSEALLSELKPKDVGWFSHANPFEFDIHHFEFHQTALRFWGGTPSVEPFIGAAHSIHYFTELGITQVREHNWALLSQLHTALEGYMVSECKIERASGTAIVSFGAHNERILAALKEQQIAVDCRLHGLRISPHLYNTQDDLNRLVEVVQAHL
ncbi:aminotransferase class V-fold PLP-dependent enzyme [Pseudoalteromonas xiamenensis]|uniref:aminotransferase class V-fold PLP-dependent enzyme n=1 Tax=Pseudoalteromonas xiamenensis TaxID=882626 RepID=UPI0035EDC1FC